MAAVRSVRGLSRENESAILAWIRQHGRRTRAHVGASVRLVCWAMGWVIVALVADALDDWMVA